MSISKDEKYQADIINKLDVADVVYDHAMIKDAIDV